MRALVCALVLAIAAPSAMVPTNAFAASEIRAVVNRQAITSGDVAKRTAFLRLQRRSGAGPKMALDELVEESLKRQEIARVGASVSTSDVDAAFARFAGSNKLSTQQLTQILAQAGVTAEHFKSYIAVQMSWPKLINARYGSRGGMSSQEVVTMMLERKEKPVTTEYFLKQVIFVVPASKKGTAGKRKAEAEASRAKFPGCDGAMDFARNYLDVSIRNLGRVMAPELPAEWKPLIEKAQGGTTGTRVTERGIEYLAICSQRDVSDDKAAEVVFRAEELGKQQPDDDANSKKYLDELRSKAQILYR